MALFKCKFKYYKPELIKYGVDTLTTARYELSATTVGDYALFGGGRTSGNENSSLKSVETYNSSLTHSTATDLSVGRQRMAATTVGNYGLFAGGYSTLSSGYENVKSNVDVYNSSLTYSTATDLSVGRQCMAATTVGNYGLFAGGINSNNNEAVTVETYNSSLTHSTATDLINSKAVYFTATTIENYALFGGGMNDIATVDVYNSSLTHSTATDLSVGRQQLFATTVGNYALFGNGIRGSAPQNPKTVDVYNSSLTHSTATNFTNFRCAYAAITLNIYAIFGGGRGGSLPASNSQKPIEVYDSSLTNSTNTNLNFNTARAHLGATIVGNYALFGGGDNGYTSGSSVVAYNTVDVYTLQ